MGQIALTIDGLGVDFGGFKAVNNVSLTVEDGELRVLLGANGAGKTTLMDLVSGKTKSTEGRVFLHDNDITNWEEHKIARAGVEAARRVVEAAPGTGVGILTLFAFSSDNWQRPAAEVDALMRLMATYLENETSRCEQQGVRLEVIGRRDRLGAGLCAAIARAEDATAGGRRQAT